MAAARIVHISADFPDPVAPSKTPVIRDLVGLVAGEFAHQVYSLNRQSPAPGALVSALLRAEPAIAAEPFPEGLALRYSAPPRGILHATMLKGLGRWLARDLRRQGPLPDLLLAHKLTVEGIAVGMAARELGVPFGLCLQGNTDGKILAARPDLVPHLRGLYHEAAVVFPFTPWARDTVERKLGPRTGPTHLLPCPTDLDTPLAPRLGGPGLISVFHLRGQHTKNLSGMAEASRLLVLQNEGLPLTIIGGGNAAEQAECRTVVGQGTTISFAGPVTRAAMQAAMNAATALVLPSRRESFGLVFIEALFAGLPIIYPAGAGVDGYFDDAPFALRVDASDPADIARAMRQAVAEEQPMKEALARWQQAPDARRFTRAAIAECFASGIREALR